MSSHTHTVTFVAVKGKKGEYKMVGKELMEHAKYSNGDEDEVEKKSKRKALILKHGVGVASLAWRSVVRRECWAVFCTMPLKEWLSYYLVNPSFVVSNREEWPQLFGSILWSLWKHQNMLISDHDSASSEPILVAARRLARNCRDACSLSAGRNVLSRFQCYPQAETEDQIEVVISRCFNTLIV
ncbi:hypothetical protein V6N13_035356 [Hibiscus sabdariffa]